MCIICAVQGGSHRAIGMLQWLMIPAVLVWSVSQLLPPGFRLEITSPRLACAAVLLGTIFWYEIFLPQVSAYRARRLARLREEQLSMAAEAQKLRKTATRRCRNCLAVYRDQNPGGGKFVCSSCGHFSKRPILDLPGHSGIRTSGLFSEFAWMKSWFCNLWFSPRNIGDWDAPVEASSCLRDGEGFSQESKGERARRKAEEKRLARLEKEMVEEEERLQREEVARLIEERRKLREEKTESDKDGKREESDRKRRSRRREKDKSPAKSNTSASGDHDNPRQESSCSGLRTRVENENILIKREKLPSLSSPTFSPRKKPQAATFPANRALRPASGSSNSHPEKSKLSLSLPVRTVEPPTTSAPKKSWHQLFAEKDEVLEDPCFKDLSSGSRIKDDLTSDLFQKPSPIESPTSKSGSLIEGGSENASEQGTWQMWSSSLCKNGLDLVGGPASWLSALDQNRVTQATTMTPAEMETNIVEKSRKRCENFDARELKDDGMGNQFIAEHHPWDGMVASQMHSFQSDEKCHLSHLWFDVGVAEKMERCLRPNMNMYASRMPLNPSQAYYYYRGWPIPWKRNMGIPMVFVPPRRRGFFVPSPMYSQPAFSP